jgi:hypothetical protein
MNTMLSIIEANLLALLKQKIEHPNDTNLEESYKELLNVAQKNEPKTFEKYKNK